MKYRATLLNPILDWSRSNPAVGSPAAGHITGEEGLSSLLSKPAKLSRPVRLRSGWCWGRGQLGHQGQEIVVASCNTAGQRLGLMCGPVKVLLRPS